MTLFTKDDCTLCMQLKKQFDLAAMDVHVEVLDTGSPEALAHLAWHSLVETARKALPILVLDDSSAVVDFSNIEHHLRVRAGQYGVIPQHSLVDSKCVGGGCAL